MSGRKAVIDANVAAAALVATGADYLWTNDKDILDEFPGIATRHVPEKN